MYIWLVLQCVTHVERAKSYISIILNCVLAERKGSNLDSALFKRVLPEWERIEAIDISIVLKYVLGVKEKQVIFSTF